MFKCCLDHFAAQYLILKQDLITQYYFSPLQTSSLDLVQHSKHPNRLISWTHGTMSVVKFWGMFLYVESYSTEWMTNYTGSSNSRIWIFYSTILVVKTILLMWWLKFVEFDNRMWTFSDNMRILCWWRHIFVIQSELAYYSNLPVTAAEICCVTHIELINIQKPLEMFYISGIPIQQMLQDHFFHATGTVSL